MADIEKVIKGLENCSETNGNCRWKEHPDCPYIERCKAKDYSALNRDAMELLKEQEESIPVSWLTEKLVGHPELPYAVTDGIINVLDLWEGR